MNCRHERILLTSDNKLFCIECQTFWKSTDFNHFVMEKQKG